MKDMAHKPAMAHRQEVFGHPAELLLFILGLAVILVAITVLLVPAP